MKIKSLVALTLAAALSLPLMAQQTVPPQVNPPADQPQAEQPQQPAAEQTSERQPLQLERREGFWGKLNPFARKKYVQRQVEPVVNRVNELDELTARNGKMIRDVDSRAQQGIRLADAKATHADQRALEAGSRAQLAHQTAEQASTRLQVVEQAVENVDRYQPVTELEIRFRSGQSILSQRAKEALDDLAAPLKDDKGYILEVQGFATGSGRAAVQNSQRMADAVVRYLVLSHEIPVHRIFVVGMGNAPVAMSSDEERPRRNRINRVEVALLRNSLAELHAEPIAVPEAQQQPAPAAGTQLPSSDVEQPEAEEKPEAEQPEAEQPEPPQKEQRVYPN